MPNKQSSEMRKAVKRAMSSVSTLEAMALRFVNRGESVSGKELTRTEFRVMLAHQADTIRQQLRDVLDQAILEQ